VLKVTYKALVCPVTTTARAQMYHVIKALVNGESKLQQCLNLSCDKKKVARFVSCDLWNYKHALVSKAIAMFLQKAWGICNAYKHGTPVDVFESASERRGANGIDAIFTLKMKSVFLKISTVHKVICF
jgi:CelD/BcsL family acetyltransferase involved in cellulose biosynthesis